MSNEMKTSQIQSRMNVINVIYISELTGEKIKMEEIRDNYNLSESEFKSLDWICAKYDQLKTMIEKFTKQGWKWERMAPLERSIMIYGAFELSFRDKKIVINELILLAKGYIAQDSYKFINAILDKVASYYETKK